MTTESSRKLPRLIAARLIAVAARLDQLAAGLRLACMEAERTVGSKTPRLAATFESIGAFASLDPRKRAEGAASANLVEACAALRGLALDGILLRLADRTVAPIPTGTRSLDAKEIQLLSNLIDVGDIRSIAEACGQCIGKETEAVGAGTWMVSPPWSAAATAAKALRSIFGENVAAIEAEAAVPRIGRIDDEPPEERAERIAAELSDEIVERVEKIALGRIAYSAHERAAIVADLLDDPLSLKRRRRLVVKARTLRIVILTIRIAELEDGLRRMRSDQREEHRSTALDAIHRIGALLLDAAPIPGHIRDAISASIDGIRERIRIDQIGNDLSQEERNLSENAAILLNSMETSFVAMNAEHDESATRRAERMLGEVDEEKILSTFMRRARTRKKDRERSLSSFPIDGIGIPERQGSSS
jgi:hypothetical protein